MKILQTLVLTLLASYSLKAISADVDYFNGIELLNTSHADGLTLAEFINNNSNNLKLNYNFSNNNFHLSLQNQDWINTPTQKHKSPYSISADKNSFFGNQVSVAWNFNKYVKFNFNLFENQAQDNRLPTTQSVMDLFIASSNKSTSKTISDELNRSISGYTFGISSELGLGNNYKLGLNLDYGQIDGANLMGFTHEQVATTSLAVGIRKSKFGASVNTDMYLQEDFDTFDNSRLGFEFDWYFSDETKISLGSKQRINNTNTDNTSLDSLTGNVQYIKFQRNL